MWTIIKLLTSLADAFPALKDIALDVISALKSWSSSSRKRRKDEEADLAIARVERSLRESQSREQSKADK